ncbi:calcium-binding protein [Donghicola sp.]|uniref:calcium-binding protein n=1 Tax=Donghicola sp. TaxID=1929294 RepID=UPI0025D94D81|nr:calcium-binding protein [Donghicola sp.]MCT4577687.1 hypothetical protein [Donghicola sp.]
MSGAVMFLMGLASLGILGGLSGGMGSEDSGESDDDRIVGDAEDDTLEGADGNDLLLGEEGNDLLDGGQGNDTLLGNSATEERLEAIDALMAAPNLTAENYEELNHILSAAPDDENDGDDSYYGGDGDDVIFDGHSDQADADRLYGGSGNDIMMDFDGASRFYGGLGNDTIVAVDGYAPAAKGADVLRGDGGDDILWGDDGDTMAGGAGNDQFNVYADSLIVDTAQDGEIDDMVVIDDWEQGEDIIFDYDPMHVLDGTQTQIELRVEEDTDETGAFASVFQEEEGLRVEFMGQTVMFIKHADLSAVPHITLNQYVPDYENEDFETLGNGADNTMVGDSTANSLNGGDGNDWISGYAESDLLLGDAGDDTLDGGTESDTLMGGDGDDLLNGDDGDDHLNGQAGNDTLNGGAGLDSLVGGTGNDSMDGGADDDTLIAGEGDDTLDGGAGLDLLSGGAGADNINGGENDDRITGDSGADTIDGGDGNDSINGGDDADVISGGLGLDYIQGGDGADTIEGGEGNDTITAGTGEDVVTAGNGDDSVEGGDDNDVLFGDQRTLDQIDDLDALGAAPNLTLANSNALREFLSAEPDGVNDGDDSYYGGAGDDILYDGYSYTEVEEQVDFDLLEGGDGDDRIFDFDGSSTLNGGAGDDVLVAVEGFEASFVKDYVTTEIREYADILRGGEGNDTLIGDDGDTLQGGAGVDTFEVYIDSVIEDNGQHLMLDDMASIDDWEPGEKIIIEYDPMHYLDGTLDDDELAALEGSNDNLTFFMRQEEEGVLVAVWNTAEEEGLGLVFIAHTTIDEVSPDLTFKEYVPQSTPVGEDVLLN